jgi:DNA-binding MarR family transcriptional regulator
LLNIFAREIRVSPARLKLLHEFLHQGQAGISPGDLALRLGVTPALITRQVKELELEGIVERKPDPKDNRRFFIQLSSKGVEKLIKLQDRVHLLEAALIKDLDPDQVNTTTQTLISLREKMESWRRTGRFLLDQEV